MKNLSRKRVLCVLAAAAPLLVLSVFLFGGRADAARLTRLETQLLQSSFSGDTLSLHFTLAEPAKWGLDKLPAALPVYSASAGEEANVQLQKLQKRLSRIHPERLSEADALRYTLLQQYLAEREEALRFPFYQEALSPSSGAQTQFPVLMAEFPLRSRADVQQYLALLAQTGAYFDGLLDYEKERAAAGLFLSDESARAVIAQCDALMDEASVQGGSHFLCQTFAERLGPLLESGAITQEEQARYLAENSRILRDVVVPAYRRLAEQLALLQGDHPQDRGLCALPDGKAYYAYLAARATGSDQSVPELRALLLERLREDFHALAALSVRRRQLCADPEDYDALAAQAGALLPDAPQDILADLRQRMARDFPALAADGKPLAEDAIRCTVRAVPDSLEPYVSPAYYFTPPADRVQDNTIYINRSQTPEGLSLYTTLAHEGYPGHLYQSVCFRLSEDPSLPPVRSLYYYGGYTEGWAMYVEMRSYEYARQAIREAGGGDLADFVCTLERLNRDMQLCLYSLLDIAIHYDGAALEDVQALLGRFGLSPETARAVYRYIAQEPANYLKYFVGYLKILECRDYVKTLWGEAYSDLAFHTFFLQTGPCRFSTLRAQAALFRPQDVPQAADTQRAGG